MPHTPFALGEEGTACLRDAVKWMRGFFELLGNAQTRKCKFYAGITWVWFLDTVVDNSPVVVTGGVDVEDRVLRLGLSGDAPLAEPRREIG